MARERRRAVRPPLLWTGVLFAFAANVLFVNLMDRLVRAVALSVTFESLATLVAPLLVGVVTHLYVRQRGGMHAFLGGLLSVPVLAFVPFDGNWRFAILAGAFCTLGGAITEVLTRGRAVR
jgi:hypothetical protein